ncbi:MAG: M24 family metallopeptidase [Bacteroidetes bacterium]|nr:M24 family metallopeptidase [Bacteroidota bacterium]
MKSICYLLVSLLSFMMISCQSSKENSERFLWKNEPSHLLTKDEVNQEIAVKMEKVKKFLNENHLKGMLLNRVSNFYWMTAGLADNQIELNKQGGAASLLILDNGEKYLLSTESEKDLLMDEALRDLGYKSKWYSWYETNPVKDVRGDIIRELAGSGRVGADIDLPGTININEKFTHLRYQLTNSEVKKYEWLGKQVTKAVDDVCKSLMPGMNEYQMEAMTAEALSERGIVPTVLLIAVNQRIYKYRHALPVGDTLKDYGMINVCAQKWGLIIAVTRFVHFGPLSKELSDNLHKVAILQAEYQAATIPGASINQIFENCKKWYAELDDKGEWMNHHQGGAIGYDNREYIAYPGNPEVVQIQQGFAWNPTIPGAKVEQTIIAFKDRGETITKDYDYWPMINVKLNGKVYPQPGILIKDPKTGKIVTQKTQTIEAPSEK